LPQPTTKSIGKIKRKKFLITPIKTLRRGVVKLPVIDEEIVGFVTEGGASLFNLINPVSVLPSKEFSANVKLG